MSDDTTKPAESSKPAETRTERRARLATVRSRVLDVTTVVSPDPNKHYEFVHNDEVAITRKMNLGFEVEDASKVMKAHGDGTKPIVGDAILMSCSKEVKEDHDFLEREEYERRHGKGGVGKGIADREYESGVRGEGFEDVDDGRTKSIDGAELKSIVES